MKNSRKSKRHLFLKGKGKQEEGRKRLKRNLGEGKKKRGRKKEEREGGDEWKKGKEEKKDF